MLIWKLPGALLLKATLANSLWKPALRLLAWLCNSAVLPHQVGTALNNESPVTATLLRAGMHAEI